MTNIFFIIKIVCGPLPIWGMPPEISANNKDYLFCNSFSFPLDWFIFHWLMPLLQNLDMAAEKNSINSLAQQFATVNQKLKSKDYFESI